MKDTLTMIGGVVIVLLFLTGGTLGLMTAFHAGSGRVVTEPANVEPFPLHAAAAHYPDRLSDLIAARYDDLDSLNVDGYTALQFAVIRGDLDSVNQLLAAGADINAGKEDASPLAHAAIWNSVDKARLLLEFGADPNKKTEGQTPLHRAAVFGSVDVARLLLETEGIDPNAIEDQRGRTALHQAVSFGNFEIVSILLRHGADENIEDIHGNKAFDLADNRSRESIERILRIHADDKATTEALAEH